MFNINVKRENKHGTWPLMAIALMLGLLGAPSAVLAADGAPPVVPPQEKLINGLPPNWKPSPEAQKRIAQKEIELQKHMAEKEAAAAAAYAMCQGVQCHGRDPEAMGCTRDAVTLASGFAPKIGAKVELRYSARCKARWSRVSPPGNGVGTYTAFVGDGNYTRRSGYALALWSGMWSWPVRACVEYTNHNDSYPDPATRLCTIVR